MLNDLHLSPLDSSSLRKCFRPITIGINSTMKNAPNGRSMLAERLSKRLKIVGEMAHMIPVKHVETVVTMTALRRFMPNCDLANVTTTSKSEIDDVIAAMARRRKKMIDMICPAAILLKMFGKVTNTSPGPLSGSMPNENAHGKIIIPAIRATMKSMITMENALRCKFCRLLMYEP